MGLPVSSRTAPTRLTDYYHTLFEHFGPQGWWPARTRMEVILGAVLTQNTSWKNAVLALKRLRRAGLLRPASLRNAKRAQLEYAIREAGFFRQKASTIQNFVRWLEWRHHGSLHSLFSTSSQQLRQNLLGLKGLGPETADVILLYAGHRPFFVADAYTRRVLSRHGWLSPNGGYAQAQELLHRLLPRDSKLFGEFHALLVEVGKRYCRRPAPDCRRCPLSVYLPGGTMRDENGPSV